MRLMDLPSGGHQSKTKGMQILNVNSNEGGRVLVRFLICPSVISHTILLPEFLQTKNKRKVHSTAKLWPDSSVRVCEDVIAGSDHL